MTSLRTAAQQALEALQNCANGEDDVLLTRDALAALRAALAEPQEPDSPERRCGGPGCDMKCCQPVQEPVGAVLVNRESREGVMFYSVDMIPDPSTLKDRFELVPVYTSPPQRKPLPASEIVTMYDESPRGDSDMIAFARAIEAAHGIKENT